jgi:hypothetical protein
MTVRDGETDVRKRKKKTKRRREKSGDRIAANKKREMLKEREDVGEGHLEEGKKAS